MKRTDAITVGGYLSSSQMQRQGKLAVAIKGKGNQARRANM